jgi:hypothetical protein
MQWPWSLKFMLTQKSEASLCLYLTTKIFKQQLAVDLVMPILDRWLESALHN